LEYHSASYDSDSYSWQVEVADRISFIVSAMWRMLEEIHIWVVSIDRAAAWAIKPIDLAYEVSSILSGKSVVEIKVQHLTSYLLLAMPMIFISKALSPHRATRPPALP